MNAMKVARLLIRAQTLVSIIEFIVEESPMNVMNAGKPSNRAQTLLGIRKFILVRKFMNECGKTFSQSSDLTQYRRNHRIITLGTQQ